MVNLIHQFQPGGAVVDKAALEQFQKQWATYQKLVDEDYLSHNGGRASCLQATLNETFAEPFAFVDIACGDASEMKRALAGVEGRATITASTCRSRRSSSPPRTSPACPSSVELDHRDFVEAMNDRPGARRRRLVQPLDPPPAAGREGAPARRHPQGDQQLPDDLRADAARRRGPRRYLARFIRVNQPVWTALTPDEWGQIEHHVVTCDFPETSAGWLDIGRQAGFAKAEQIFDDPTNFYRVYRFDV